MNYLQILSLFLGMALLSTACHSPRTPKDLSRENLIPLPVSVAATGSSFLLESGSRIYVASEDLLPLGEHLAAYLRPATGFNLPVNASQANPTTGDIYFSLAEDAELGAEGYQLEITEGLVHISANEPAGLFYGIQTLRQLLPPAIEKNTVQKGPWEIATGTIRDYPEYAYRGSMLDVARHFFAVEEVKQYIDHLVTYKMNYLHLHLSDDQGWRIEIKSWPKLTEVGGSTEVGGGEGGFYTQEQYAELVTYAAERYVTLVPEIDMPGHTMAALASYPELYCPGKGKEPALYTGIEVGFSTLCVDKELTYQFVDDVVREIAAITPGPYFHLGGDESLSTPLMD
jgi:hexosaminidase